MALPGVNPTFRFLDDGAPDGTVLGQNITSKVGFWGTVTTQPTATQQAVAISTAAMSSAGTNGGWLYVTSTQADGVVRLVNQLRNDLVQLGLLKGS